MTHAPASAPITITIIVSALALVLLAPRDAMAQSGGNPGQFGGSPPGQFDPNAIPGAQPTAAPPGQFDPNALPGAQPSAQPARPGQFDPNAIPGGSASPTPPFSGPPDPNDPNTNLDAAKEEDSGRGLTWFWIEAGGGFEHVGLETIDGGAPSATGTGPMVDGGLGLRLLFLTAGARARLGFFGDYDLARVGGEVGLRVPLGSIEPRINAGGGYAAAMNEGTATGFYARAGGGLDVFLASSLSLGGDVSFDLIGLSADTGGGASTSLGLGVALGLHVGLHL